MESYLIDRSLILCRGWSVHICHSLESEDTARMSVESVETPPRAARPPVHGWMRVLDVVTNARALSYSQQSCRAGQSNKAYCFVPRPAVPEKGDYHQALQVPESGANKRAVPIPTHPATHFVKLDVW